MGANEDVLEGVLGVGAGSAEHLGGIRQQADAVAVVNRAKRVVGAGAEECDELVVGVEAQDGDRNCQPRSRDRCGAWEGGGFHSLARLPL